MADEQGSKRVDFSNAATGRAAVMQALHNELGTFIDLAVNASEKDWLTQSACESWATATWSAT